MHILNLMKDVPNMQCSIQLQYVNLCVNNVEKISMVFHLDFKEFEASLRAVPLCVCVLH